MTVSLNESLSFSATGSGTKWRVKVIESGWGSSGYYPAEMLAEYGPKTFTKGTKVYINHPTNTEANERPERDVNQLAGKLVSDAQFDGTGLTAEIQFYSHFAPIIREMAGDVGLSIRAMGDSRLGEAEGRQGPIIESMVADPLTSVDVVTVAGAGGKFLSLLESYKAKDDEAISLSESVSEGNESMITKEEFEAAFADLKSALVEAISPLSESVKTLVESATPAETEGTDEAAEEVEAVDPVEIAEKFNESGLPKISLKRVAEAMKSETNTKSVDELIESEKAYVSAVSESAVNATAADTVGVITEATKTNSADEFDAIVSRLSGK